MAQTCILVSGMHRSGTSALTGVLEKLGVYLGSDLMGASASNVQGHFENIRLYKLNEAILKRMGSKWDDVLYNEKLLNDRAEIDLLTETLEKEFSHSDTFLIKDPRLAYLLPLYVNALQQMGISIKIIIPIRSPFEVANSLKQRNGFSIEKGILLWTYHFLLSEKYSRGLPRFFTQFNDLVQNPEELIQKLSAGLGLNISKRYKEYQAEILEFLRPDLKHHNISLDNFSGLVPDIVHECMRLSEQLNIHDFSAELDALYTQIFEYQALYYNDDIRGSLAELENTLHKLEFKEGEVEKLKKQAAQLESRNFILAQEVSKRDKKVVERDSIIQAYKNSTSWRITAPLRVFSKGGNGLVRNIRRAFKLAWWLCTGKSRQAIAALLFFYQNSIPARIKGLIPNWIHGFVRRRLKLERGSDFPLHPPISTHKVKQNIKESGVHGYVRIKVDEPVSIIIPIFNALDDLKLCIERVLKYTHFSTEVILINDASTDKKVSEFLETLDGISHFRIFHNETNLGFTKTVNRGIGLAESADVVLLNSDARVTPRWLEGIRNALSYDANIGTVTPMSDRAGAFSAPQIGNNNPLPSGIKEEDYAVAFRRYAMGHYPSVPTGNGFCMYIRRACLNEVGLLDADAFPRGYGEENDFCMRAGRLGWRHIVDDRTYVFHDRNKSFGGEKDNLIKEGRKIVNQRYPEYTKAIKVFFESPLLSDARKRAEQAMRELQLGRGIKPRVLYVISTLTGGTPQTNRDLMEALSDDIEPWLLRCDSKTISLYKVNKGQEVILEKQHQLMEPLTMLTHVSYEYDYVVSAWLFEMDFELVHIRHLVWHSLTLPRLVKNAGAKVVLSFHDFYSVCPTVNLLDEKGRYCSGACTNTLGDCSFPLWGDKDALPQLKNEWVYIWRESFSKNVIAYSDSFVTTHGSAKDVISRIFDIPDDKFHVIPHGRDFKEFYQLAKNYRDGDILKILVPGNIGQQKGADIIKGLVDLDGGRHLHFHILGRCVSKLTSGPGITVHGTYLRDEFADHVKKIKPHIGAVLSVWNETWCHTLTELWSVGLPVIVTNYPTVKQRVDDSGAGWIVEHGDIPALYNEIVNTIATSKNVREKTEKTIAHQDTKMKEMTTQAMAECYKSVYEMELLQSQSTRKLRAGHSADSRAKDLIAIVPLNKIGYPEGTGYIRVIMPLQHSSMSSILNVQISTESTYAKTQQKPAAILVQRDAIRIPNQGQELVRYCSENGIKLIYEIDDDLFHLPDSHSASTRFSTSTKEAMEIIVKGSDAVIVSTEALKLRLNKLNNNVVVLPNALDERLWSAEGEFLQSNDESDVVRILYMGSPTHDEDLAIVGDAIKEVKQKYGEKVSFTCIGGFSSRPFKSVKMLRLPYGAAEYPEFAKWMANNCDYDIAIAPLVDNEFNKHKSYIKYLDYGICGIAPVLSDVPPYREVVRDRETGLLVENTTEAWFEALSMLIEDPVLRQKIGQNARGDILKHYTLIAQSKQRVELWESIIS